LTDVVIVKLATRGNTVDRSQLVRLSYLVLCRAVYRSN